MNEQERAAFEKWANPRSFQLNRDTALGHGSDEDYIFPATDYAWKIWQAARAAGAEQEKELRRSLEYERAVVSQRNGEILRMKSEEREREAALADRDQQIAYAHSALGGNPSVHLHDKIAKHDIHFSGTGLDLLDHDEREDV